MVSIFNRGTILKPFTCISRNSKLRYAHKKIRDIQFLFKKIIKKTTWITAINDNGHNSIQVVSISFNKKLTLRFYCNSFNIWW